jgi:hypothetical protein
MRYRDLLTVENLFLRTKAVIRTCNSSTQTQSAVKVFHFSGGYNAHRLENLSRDAGIAPGGKRSCITIVCNNSAFGIVEMTGWCAPMHQNRSRASASQRRYAPNGATQTSTLGQNL